MPSTQSPPATSSLSRKHELAARATKAAGLILALSRFAAYRGTPVTAASLLRWSNTSWELLAQLANVNPPSMTTRSMVIEQLATSEAALVEVSS